MSDNLGGNVAYSATFNFNPNLGTTRRGHLLCACITNRRSYTYSDSYRFGYTYGYSHSFSNANTDPYSYTHGHGYSDRDADRNGDC